MVVCGGGREGVSVLGFGEVFVVEVLVGPTSLIRPTTGKHKIFASGSHSIGSKQIGLVPQHGPMLIFSYKLRIQFVMHLS